MSLPILDDQQYEALCAVGMGSLVSVGVQENATFELLVQFVDHFFCHFSLPIISICFLFTLSSFPNVTIRTNINPPDGKDFGT